MSQVTSVGLDTEFGPDRPSQWRVWSLFLLLAFLLHLLFLMIRFGSVAPLAPPKVEVQTIDPKKLDAVRRQWKNKGLVLDKTPKAKSEAEASPDARYMSDRNIRVEKEQRARNTNILPKPGQPDGGTEERAQQQRKQLPKTQARRYPNLGSLGVPLHLGENPPQPVTAKNENSENRPAQHQQGGEQAFLDNQLPLGSENLLNAQESVYYSFFARLYESIGPIWQSRLRGIPPRGRVNPGTYVTSVDVILDHAGNLVEVRRLQSSGIPDFDTAVDESWKTVGRFPNPPQGLLDKENLVHTGWSFAVQVAEGFNMRYLPPERTY